MFGHFHADVRASGSHFFDGIDELVAGTFLGEITLRSGTNGAYGVLLFFIHRQHQNEQFGCFGPDLADQIDSASSRHRQIEQQHIESAFSDLTDHGKTIDGFADNRNFIIAFEYPFQAFAHQGMVVRNNNSDHIVVQG